MQAITTELQTRKGRPETVEVRTGGSVASTLQTHKGRPETLSTKSSSQRPTWLQTHKGRPETLLEVRQLLDEFLASNPQGSS